MWARLTAGDATGVRRAACGVRAWRLAQADHWAPLPGAAHGQSRPGREKPRAGLTELECGWAVRRESARGCWA
jgi:hypothetical protein